MEKRLMVLVMAILLVAMTTCAMAEELIDGAQLPQTLTWEYLATTIGAALFTLLVVQFVKEPLDRFVKLPTAFVAYLVALVTLIVATWMTKGMDAQELLLCLFNALLAATSAMGMYEKTFAKANKTEY